MSPSRALRADDNYRAAVLDSHLRTRHHFLASGTPPRARVSPSGHAVAWTAFVSGDSYAGIAFSIRTALADTCTWALDDNLEAHTVIKDGHPYHPSDLNISGVTFLEDTRFHSTLATAGHAYLVRGDRTLTTHPNVECAHSPSTAPASRTRSAPTAPLRTPPGGCASSTSPACEDRHGQAP
ncbi:hypothetical protein ACFVFQ_38375 [Streptomyces sp. NPDC057743]|uniref:hypothetical protein n=1 Tax=Streptomyces sp. NPDC057743 TaxID=3346236 RepID=UPI00368A7A63